MKPVSNRQAICLGEKKVSTGTDCSGVGAQQFLTRLNCLILLALLIFSWGSAQADVATIRVAADQEVVNLAQHLDLYQQTAQDNPNNIALPIDEFLTNESGRDYLRNETVSINRGINNRVHWLRFTIDRREVTSQRWILHIANAMLPEISVYKPNALGEYSRTVGGNLLNQDDKEIADRAHAFGITEAVSHEHPVYISVRGNDFTLVPIKLYSEKAWVHEKRKETAIYIACFSVMFAMVVFSIFLYSSTGDKNYLYYIVYLLTCLGYGLSAEGYFHELILRNNELSVDQVLSFFAFGGLFFAALFTAHFLESKSQTPIMYRWLVASMVFSGVATIFHVSGIKHPLISLSGVLSGIFVPITIFVAALRSVMLGNPTAKYFLVAWGMLIMTTLYVMTYYLGFVYYDVVIQYGMYAAAAAESLLLAFALAYRIKRLESEKRTAKREMYNALREKYEQLESVQKLKDRFLSNVSHELRTPINGIYGSLDLISCTSMDGEQQHLVGLITGCSKQLQTTVDRILDYAELDSGAAQLSRDQFYPEQLFRDIFTEMVGRALSRGLMLELELPGSDNQAQLPTKVEGSKEHIIKIVEQLLDNAIKFTKEGGINLSVGWESTDAHQAENKGNLKISIADSGKGLSRDIERSLFEAFEQKDSSLTREQEGVGLGLAMVTGIIKLMDGALETKAREGGGSIIEVTIPLLTVVTEVEQKEESRTPDVSAIEDKSDHKKILIVEDNPTNALVLKGLLKKLGYIAETAENGEIGVSLATVNHYDLIFMDCQMPIMDGYEATRKLRKLPEYNKTPIVAVTANAHSTDKAQCLDAGMDDYIKKPVNRSIIQGALDRWIILNERKVI